MSVVKSPKLWISLLIFSIILLVSFSYNDIIITTRHGINFWDNLFQGRIMHFYQDNKCMSGNIWIDDYVGIEQGCAYNILVYLCFAVWNFPLWILEKFSIDVMNNIPCLIWANLLPVFATLLSARYIWLFLKEDGNIAEERIIFSEYIYLFSSLLLSSVLINSRYDSLCSIFMLLSLRGFYRKDNRTFIFWSGIAFCFNYFSILIYLPLLLIYQKNVFKIFRDVVLMLIPYAVTTLPFIFFESNRGEMESKIIPYIFALTNGRFSWFVIVYSCILVYSYLSDEGKRDSELPIWVCFSSLASLFAFCLTYPYWSILLIPFIALMIGRSKRTNDKINLLVETIGMGALVIENMFLFSHCYVNSTMKPMILSVLLPDQVFNNHIIRDWWIEMGHKDTFILLLHSVFIAGMIILAIINHSKCVDFAKGLGNDKEVNVSHLIWLRWISTIVVCLLPFVTLVK